MLGHFASKPSDTKNINKLKKIINNRTKTSLLQKIVYIQPNFESISISSNVNLEQKIAEQEKTPINITTDTFQQNIDAISEQG